MLKTIYLVAATVAAACLALAPAATPIPPPPINPAPGISNDAKLRKAVNVAGMRKHEQALQNIANANGGTRASGTPGYAASVDYVGISNLVEFLHAVPQFARFSLINNWYRYGGDPDVAEQEADLLARSPITRVDQVRTPLMVVQGSNDVRVVQEESDLMVEAVRARGVEVEYLVKPDEGHRFQNPENLIDIHQVLERFLARHLGGRQTES